jgi:hypothetical protein
MTGRKGELSQPRLHCNRVCVPGALGCGLANIPDPDAKVSRRCERRIEGYVQRDRRIGKQAVKKTKPIVLAELARKGGLSDELAAVRNSVSRSANSWPWPPAE